MKMNTFKLAFLREQILQTVYVSRPKSISVGAIAAYLQRAAGIVDEATVLRREIDYLRLKGWLNVVGECVSITAAGIDQVEGNGGELPELASDPDDEGAEEIDRLAVIDSAIASLYELRARMEVE